MGILKINYYFGTCQDSNLSFRITERATWLHYISKLHPPIVDIGLN